MKKYVWFLLSLCVLLTFAMPVCAQEAEAQPQDTAKRVGESGKNTQKTNTKVNESKDTTTSENDFDASELIMGHIKDSHVWHILDYTKEKDNGKIDTVQVAVPLPVIVFANGHLDLFMSGAFEHGHEAVTKGDNTYILVNDQIFLANDKGGITFKGDGNNNKEMDLHSSLHFLKENKDAEILNEKPFDFSITKNVASMMLASIILLIVFISFAKAYKKNPGSPKGMQAFLEPLFLYVRDDIVYPNLGAKTDKFLPYLMTVFFFILFNNILGLIPFFPGNANVTGNIAVTMVLAIFTFLMINLNGNKDYWHHTFWMPGVPVFVKPILAIVELMGIIVKPVALMIRLFANISAGHIIILSLVSLIFIFGTIWVSPVSAIFVLFMDCLEMLVAFLQAYIFTMLSAVFISLAVAEHKHE